MRLSLFFSCLLLSRVVFACPTCAPAQDASRIWWVLGPFMLLPFVVVAVVISVLKKHAKLTPTPTAGEGVVASSTTAPA